MTTPATITTEWLDEAAKRAELAAEVTLPADQFKRLIEQARRAAESELVKDRAIAISSGAVAVLHEKLAVAEAALSATRERLEQVRAIIAEGMPCDCITSVVDGKTSLKLCGACKISAIAAKACTGGKGEEK